MGRRIVGVPSDGGMPVAAGGGMGEAGTHCSHRELKVMTVGNKITLQTSSLPGKQENKVPLLLLHCN